MVVSRAIIRDLYSRDRISSMISLVIAVMMIAQMLSPLTGGLLETAFGWRAIFYLITAASLTVTVFIAFALPETRRDRSEAGGFRGDVGSLVKSRAFIGYVLCQVLASQIIFTFAGGGPIWRVVCDHGVCLSDRQPVLRAVRAAPFAGETDLVRAGTAARRQPVEPGLEHHRI